MTEMSREWKLEQAVRLILALDSTRPIAMMNITSKGVKLDRVELAPKAREQLEAALVQSDTMPDGVEPCVDCGELVEHHPDCPDNMRGFGFPRDQEL